jgi:hypothetical protein
VLEEEAAAFADVAEGGGGCVSSVVAGAAEPASFALLPFVAVGVVDEGGVLAPVMGAGKATSLLEPLRIDDGGLGVLWLARRMTD